MELETEPAEPAKILISLLVVKKMVVKMIVVWLLTFKMMVVKIMVVRLLFVRFLVRVLKKFSRCCCLEIICSVLLCH